MSGEKGPIASHLVVGARAARDNAEDSNQTQNLYHNLSQLFFQLQLVLALKVCNLTGQSEWRHRWTLTVLSIEVSVSAE